MRASLPPLITDATPRTMEKNHQGHGCILYRTTIPVGPAQMLDAGSVHDFGFVYLDGQRLGVLDRRQTASSSFPRATSPRHGTFWSRQSAQVFFGQEVHDRKGIHAPVNWRGKS